MNDPMTRGPEDGVDLDAVLRRHADELRRAARVAAPESLIWRARLRARIERSEMTGRLLSLYDRIALGVGVAATAVVVAWNRDALGELLRRIGVQSATSSGSGEAGGLIIAGGVLALAALAVWAMTIWADEA